VLAKLYYFSILGQLRCQMVKLSDLGFLKGIIAETILSTYNADGTPNAAPIGVTMIDDDHLSINFFNSSRTLSNVKAKRCAVVNVTGNIEVYYETAFKEVNPESALPQEWFEKAQIIDAPKLSGADATVEVSMYHLEALSQEKARVLFKVRSLQASQTYPQVYSRGFGAALEAIVHATRVKALAKDKQQQVHVRELVEKIAACNQVVVHVAPGSSYSAVMDDLLKMIGSWEQQ
jgi:hypothetical protein